MCLRLGLYLCSPVVHLYFSGTAPPPADSSALENMFLDFQSLRIVREPPSAISQPDNYKKLQGQPNQRILDDRPSVDSLIPPISLLYDGFGIFEDIRQGFPVPGEEDINETQLWVKVYGFMDNMAKFHDSEASRRSATIDHLHQIFHARKNPGVVGGPIAASRIGSRQIISDGHLYGAHEAMVFCLECKNELTNISCKPSAELVSYIASSFKEKLGGVHKHLFRAWRVPALGMTQIGEFKL